MKKNLPSYNKTKKIDYSYVAAFCDQLGNRDFKLGFILNHF